MIDENYKEIRSRAISMAYLLGERLKEYPSTGLVYADEVRMIGEGISYLLMVAVDDWCSIKGTCAELEKLEFPTILPQLGDRVCHSWPIFCELVAKEEGCNPPEFRIADTRQKFTKLEYKLLGIDLGYLKFKKGLLGQRQTILDE